MMMIPSASCSSNNASCLLCSGGAAIRTSRRFLKMAALSKHIRVIEEELARMTKDRHFIDPSIDAMMRQLDDWIEGMYKINRNRRGHNE